MLTIRTEIVGACLPHEIRLLPLPLPKFRVPPAKVFALFVSPEQHIHRSTNSKTRLTCTLERVSAVSSTSSLSPLDTIVSRAVAKNHHARQKKLQSATKNKSAVAYFTASAKHKPKAISPPKSIPSTTQKRNDMHNVLGIITHTKSRPILCTSPHVR